ncbi:hypothetical protein CJF32_00000227 [Rutstroemia sp. NJR-2017a WRK4]|nr:hypothetical protein CJF32_00000227 [Rutstroemia sp. NJR-2017a WRK4]
MRSYATQNQGAEENYLDPEASGKMTKGSAEEEGPAILQALMLLKVSTMQEEEGEVLQTAAVLALHAIQ